MNKKMTVKTQRGIAYVVLSDARSVDEQILEVFGYDGKHGMWAGIEGEAIKVMDYFVQETLATFPILSVEDTDEPVSLKWNYVLVAPEGGLPS
ncbi:MAG: hypothetical protein J6S44_04280 [Clostridia bacterium]|nr:hypothetical protein [Clostridia bacterium]MBO7171091.1 hypothetical protein [Clostridia bacterium]